MKKMTILFIALLVCSTIQVGAQALHYDPYYVLPGAAGGIGVDAGLSTGDIGSIFDGSETYLVGKYSINDKLEAGARLTLGILHDGRDSFSDITVGAKYGLSATSALTLNVTPFNEAEEIGLSVGYMMTTQMGGMDVNNHLQIGLLDGYASGLAIDLFIEPVKIIDEKITGYLDILISTDTDAFSNNLGVDLGPNVDYALMEDLVFNAGVTVGIAGDGKQQDVGLMITAIKTMGK
ncbi:MAG: hypothetical protein HOC74_33565 [Gemmatimonadetes bacterium]|jgi:hypothetical protein|nr:hypothetical protein [Gemmatimonadota bacterium]